MSNSFGYIDIILLGMIAGFIILRLRSILGRKTGHESKVYPNFAEKEFNHKSIRIFYSELIKHGGKIYLAKDSTLNVSEFNDMYPDANAWKRVVKEVDKNNLFQSSLSKRLKIK